MGSNFYIFLVALMCLIPATFATYETCMANPNSLLYKWYCFQLFPANIAWIDAVAYCKNDSGILARVYERDQWIALQDHLNQIIANTSVSYMPWVSLSRLNGTGPTTWMHGPDYYNDKTAISIEGQGLAKNDSTWPIFSTTGMCNLFWSICKVPCCFYLQFTNTSNTQKYSLNGIGCANPTGTCMVVLKPFVCEYEKPVRVSGFKKAPMDGRINGSIQVILNSTVAVDMKRCAACCMRQSFCISFDYHTTNGTCLMWSTTLQYNPMSFVADANFKHFDILP